MADKGRYVYDWPRPMVTVEAIVFCTFPAGRKVLLIQRGQEPGKGLWAAPGGFLELDEEMEDGAARELAEETGLTGVDLIQFQTFGDMFFIFDDQRQKKPLWKEPFAEGLIVVQRNPAQRVARVDHETVAIFLDVQSDIATLQKRQVRFQQDVGYLM